MQKSVLRIILSVGLIVLPGHLSFAVRPDVSPASSGDKSISDGGKGMEVLAASASRHAVLIGVNNYEQCGDLTFCKVDVTALSERLVEIGFDRRDIAVLTDGAKILPSRRNIVEQLDAALKVADAGDLVVVALSGHGARFGGRSYFCPMDARPEDPDGTMIAIDELYGKLENCPARLKMVFIDACRNNFLPVEAKPLIEQSKSIDSFAKSLSDGSLPRGVVLLASCTSGERSWEDKAFGHGVFMHYVLQGLTGDADRTTAGGNRDGWVSLFELCDYVRMETKTHVLRTRRTAQRPYYHTSIDLPDFRLTKIETKIVIIQTSLGNISVKLDAKKSPITVENFLRYVEDNYYKDTIFHQVFPGYAVLGGGSTKKPSAKPERPPIRNEANNGLKNLRGTIAMVRRPDVIDSATYVFFFNLSDNPALDHKDDATAEGYGYCVFGKVVDGMDVLDRISKQPTREVMIRDGDTFKNVPVKNIIIKSIRLD